MALIKIIRHGAVFWEAPPYKRPALEDLKAGVESKLALAQLVNYEQARLKREAREEEKRLERQAILEAAAQVRAAKAEAKAIAKAERTKQRAEKALLKKAEALKAKAQRKTKSKLSSHSGACRVAGT